MVAMLVANGIYDKSTWHVSGLFHEAGIPQIIPWDSNNPNGAVSP